MIVCEAFGVLLCETNPGHKLDKPARPKPGLCGIWRRFIDSLVAFHGSYRHLGVEAKMSMLVVFLQNLVDFNHVVRDLRSIVVYIEKVKVSCSGMGG